MMKYLRPLPVVLAAILLALFSFAWLGQTHMLSALVGARHLPAAAEISFFCLAAVYAVILTLLRRRFAGRIFAALLWALNIALLLLILPALWR